MKLAILFSFFCFLAVNEAHVMKCGTPLTNRCATGVATVSCGILPWCRGHGMRVKKVSPTQCCCYKKGKTEVVIIKGGKVVVQAGDGGDGGDGGRGGYAAGIGGKAGSGGFGGDGGEGGIVNITYVGGYAAIREKVEHLEDHDDPNNTPAEYDYEEIPDDERDMVVIIESAEVFFEGGEGGEGGDGGAAGIARRGTNGTEGVDGDDGTDGAIVGGSAFKNGGTVIINGRVAQEYLKTLPFDSRGHYTNTGTIYINAFDGGDGGAGGVGGNSTSTLGKAGSGGVGGEGGDGGDLVIQQ